MQGSYEQQPFPGVTITSISPEAKDLLEKIMECWKGWESGLKRDHGEDYVASHYGFAYWLVRYSGLIKSNEVITPPDWDFEKWLSANFKYSHADIWIDKNGSRLSTHEAYQEFQLHKKTKQ